MAGHLPWQHQGGSEAATERAQGNGSGSERSRLARQRPLEASIPPHRSESIWECGVYLGLSGSSVRCQSYNYGIMDYDYVNL